MSSAALSRAALAALAMLGLVTGGPALAAQNTAIKIQLEEPTFGSPATGISNLRGWAAGPNGIDVVELYIDGGYRTNIPYGGARNDVCDKSDVASYPDCDLSGFSMIRNFSLLSEGAHTFTVRAVAPNGDFNLDQQTVYVDPWHKGYINSDTAMDLGGATFTRSGNDLNMKNVSVDGVAYDLKLRWNKDMQAPKLISIGPAAEGSSINVTGVWFNIVRLDESGCGGDFTYDSGNMSLSQNGSIVTVGDSSSGVLNGTRLTYSESASDGASSLTISWSIDFDQSASFMDGTGNFVYTSGGSTCTGTIVRLGSRI